MMRWSIRQAHFLESILKEGRANKREDLIRHANKDQINAVSELTLNLLKSKLPLQPQHVIRLKPYRNQMRNLANKSLSQKKWRDIVLSQRGSGFLKVLGCCLL